MSSRPWKVLIKDSYTIIDFLLKEKPSSLSELRQSVDRLQLNNSSRTILVGLLTHLDREMNRIQYYGLWRYFTDRYFSQGRGNNMMMSDSAKIPFMLTALQKQYLHQDLHYSLDQIKTLTPLEAMRIIDNKIHAQNYQKSTNKNQ